MCGRAENSDAHLVLHFCQTWVGRDVHGSRWIRGPYVLLLKRFHRRAVPSELA